MATAFDPYDLAGTKIANRIVMAPMTRSRATDTGEATEIMATYYAQRASGGLLITEATQPSVVGQGYMNTPGLHTVEQVESWRPVTAAVHREGGTIFAQLMHAGRISDTSLLPDGFEPVAPSAIAAKGQVFTAEGPKDFVAPKELTSDEIEATVQDFADAARHAIEAGFDGVEIHGANGYLVHQFLAAYANQRTDEWGGSVEGRIRFAVEVATAVAAAVGGEKVGIRLSPGAPHNDIQGETDQAETYGALLASLAPLGLAYVHLLEAADNRDLTRRLRAAWPSTFILNPSTGAEPTGPDALGLVEDGTADLVSFGAMFLANPDLPARLAAGGPFNTPDQSSFYGGDENGYTTYPTLG